MTGKALIGLLFVGCAVAQPPFIYNRSIYNAASYVPLNLPGGAIARGSIFSIFGRLLGPSQALPNAGSPLSFPLSTTLGNVSVTVTQGATAVNAIPVYVSDSQINAIMPSNAPLGASAVRVLFNNGRSNPVPIVVTSSAFGIFTATGTGLGPGVLTNYVSADSQPVNSPSITAQPGQLITLYGTGLGPVNGPDNVAPPAGNLPIQTEVFVGGVPAQIAYSGRSPCCSGLDQIVFTVPNNAPAGCWVPVFVRTGGTTVSNVVTMAVDANGASCYATLAGAFPAFFNSHRAGGFIAARATTHEDVGTTAPIDVTADYHASIAYQLQDSAFPFNPLASFPPPGSCTSYSVKGDLLGGDPLPGAVPNGKLLDFGPLFSLSGPRGTRALTELFSGSRVGYLGGALSNNAIPSTLFLEPGGYTLMGTGGLDVGPFSTTFTVPQPLIWTNRDQLTLIDRTKPITVTWTGTVTAPSVSAFAQHPKEQEGIEGDYIGLIGFGEDLPNNASTVFACLALQGATSLTVPSVILANVPPTRPNPLQSKSVLYLVTLPKSTFASLPVSGLDAAFAAFSYIAGKTVIFQ